MTRLMAAFFVLALALFGGGPGFRSERLLADHYVKHGPEFGKVSKAQYLLKAQTLRDSPRGGPILEARRGAILTRFDRRHGYFGAYNLDGTIRTFFIPAAGESYFRRQARR